MKAYLFLLLAVGCEIGATAFLKKANGFTVPLPSGLAVLGYALSAYFLSLSLKTIPIGLAYSVWASLGIVSSALLGWLLYGQTIDRAGLLGMGLILTGVLFVTLVSTSPTAVP